MCLTGFCHCQGYPPPPVLTRTSYWIRDWENVCKYIMIHIMFIKLIFIIHLVVLQAKEFHMYFFVDVDVDVAEMRRWGFVEPVQLWNTLVYSVDVGDDVLLTLILTCATLYCQCIALSWHICDRLHIHHILLDLGLFFLLSSRAHIFFILFQKQPFTPKDIKFFFWTANDKKTYQKVPELSGKAPTTSWMSAAWSLFVS